MNSSRAEIVGDNGHESVSPTSTASMSSSSISDRSTHDHLEKPSRTETGLTDPNDTLDGARSDNLAEAMTGSSQPVESAAVGSGTRMNIIAELPLVPVFEALSYFGTTSLDIFARSCKTYADLKSFQSRVIKPADTLIFPTDIDNELRKYFPQPDRSYNTSAHGFLNERAPNENSPPPLDAPVRFVCREVGVVHSVWGSWLVPTHTLELPPRGNKKLPDSLTRTYGDVYAGCERLETIRHLSFHSGLSRDEQEFMHAIAEAPRNQSWTLAGHLPENSGFGSIRTVTLSSGYFASWKIHPEYGDWDPFARIRRPGRTFVNITEAPKDDNRVLTYCRKLMKRQNTCITGLPDQLVDLIGSHDSTTWQQKLLRFSLPDDSRMVEENPQAELKTRIGAFISYLEKDGFKTYHRTVTIRDINIGLKGITIQDARKEFEEAAIKAKVLDRYKHIIRLCSSVSVAEKTPGWNSKDLQCYRDLIQVDCSCPDHNDPEPNVYK